MGLFDFALSPFKSVLGDLTGQSDALEQNQKAIDAQKQMAGASNQTIRDMYSTGRSDQMPFINASLSALPLYQSAVTGQPVNYTDPSYVKLTPFDKGYVQGADKYRAPDGSIVDKAPQMSTKYDLQQDPGFQWRNQQLDRSLRALGRSNSTYGINAKGDFSGNEYNRSLGRLSQLAGFGQSNVGNVAASGNTAANQIAGVNTSTANSLSSLYGQRGGLYTDYSPMNMALNFGKAAAAGGMM
jgi:hypothetical protein